MSERVTLVNPYVVYECPDCGVRVATDSPDSVPDCPDCGLLGVALEFVGLGEFISAESKAEIERLRRVVEQVEWVEPPDAHPDLGRWCPMCRSWEAYGHELRCPYYGGLVNGILADAPANPFQGVIAALRAPGGGELG